MASDTWMLAGIKKKKKTKDIVTSRIPICNYPKIKILPSDACMIYNSEYPDAHHEKLLMARVLKLPSDFQNLRKKITFEKADLAPKRRNRFFLNFVL